MSDFKNKIWITEDGEKIPVESMPSEQIKACIHKIYKSNGSWRREYLRVFENELRKRRILERYEEI